MNRRNDRLLPLCVAALMGVWACGKSGDQREAGQAGGGPGPGASAVRVPTATAPSDACGWVTTAEVQELVGPLAGPPIPAGKECRYPLKLSDSLRAAMLEMRESDRQVFGKAREGSNPDSVALIVGVDLSGGVVQERAVGLAADMLAPQLPSRNPGASEVDTAGSTVQKTRPTGWDVAGSSLGWPGFSGRVGHVAITVYTDVMLDLVRREKMKALATRLRDRMPDRPYATDYQQGDAEMLTGGAAHDPCSLLTRTEVEAVLGKLVVAPYRSAYESPLAFGKGQSCAYYSARHHVLVVTPVWADGGTDFKMMRGIGGLVGMVVADGEAEAADTLEGPWDEAAIGLDGQLAVLKGDRLLQLGYLTSSTDATGAVNLARVAVERLARAPGEAKRSDNSLPFMENLKPVPDPALAKVNPCSLLTDDEIAAQVDLSLEPAQRQGQHDRGVQHRISRQEDREGLFPSCRFSWRSVDTTGQEWSRGDFVLHVMTATQLKMFEGTRPKSGERSKPIEGVGDEAFFAEHAPSARVGKLGVSIAEFPDTYGAGAKGGVELLRAAVQRLN